MEHLWWALVSASTNPPHWKQKGQLQFDQCSLLRDKLGNPVINDAMVYLRY